MTLIERICAAEAGDLFDWTGLPSWATEGGEHFDGNWTPDCNGKLDFDPGFMRFSCRVWNDGDYTCSLYLGDDICLEKTEILSAGTVALARQAVETWCAETARTYADIIAAAIQARTS